MAASNALFWTGKGWNGSELMMGSTIPYLTRRPNHQRIRLMSATFVKTITIAYQGMQALYLLLGGLGMRNSYGDSFAFDSLLFPLAVIGLGRIPGALWMTEDYSYADYNEDATAIKVSDPIPEDFDFHSRHRSRCDASSPKLERMVGVVLLHSSFGTPPRFDILYATPQRRRQEDVHSQPILRNAGLPGFVGHICHHSALL